MDVIKRMLAITHGLQWLKIMILQNLVKNIKKMKVIINGVQLANNM